MQGISFVLLLSFVAQTGISPLVSPMPGPPTSGRDVASGATQFGWQLDANGELEYLIQISPEMLPFMTRESNQKEFQSEIPKELAGRIHRVVVSIGTQVLPRTPSLQDIQRMVPTIASLPPGRIRDLEPDATVQNVNNDLPGFPFSNESQRTAAGNTPGPRLASPAPTTPLGSSFLDQARANSSMDFAQASPNRPTGNDGFGVPMSGQTSAGQAMQGASLPAVPGQSMPVQSNQGRFAETAPVGGTPSQAPYPNSASGWGSTAPSSGQMTDGTAGRNGQWQPSPTAPPSFPDNWAGQPGNRGPAGYGGESWGSNQRPSSQPNQGFGPPPERPGMSLADRSRGNDRWPGSLTNNEVLGRPGETLVASGNGQFPRNDFGNPGRGDSGSLANNTRDSQSQRSDAENMRQQISQGAAEGNFHLFVFFVLSVAINLWMVHLLRSLYMRYRTLLVSLRSSTS